MKLKRIILFFIFILSINNAQAENIFINFAQKNIEEKYYSNVINIKNFIYENYSSKINTPIYINVNIHKKNNNLPTTKIFENRCVVNINLKKPSPIIFKNFDDEFNFLILHETAHCLLGSDEILNKEIKFFSSADENNSIIKNTEISCNNCLKKTSFNPYISYSEIFADVFAINYFITNKADIDSFIFELQQYRYNEYYKNEQITNYLSHFYIENILSTNQLKKKTFDEMLKNSQDILIYFIKERFIGRNFTNNKSIIK